MKQGKKLNNYRRTMATMTTMTMRTTTTTMMMIMRKNKKAMMEKMNIDKDYTPLSDAEKGKMYREADEIKTVRNEAPIPTSRLRDLLNCINISTPIEFRIKRIPRPG
jgi:hypothetical protein